MNLKLSQRSIFHLLLLVAPIVDTINGYFLIYGGNSAGLSLGTLYRAVFILFMIYIIISHKMNKKEFFLLCLICYFPVVAVIHGTYDRVAAISYLTYSIKWMLPVLIIITYRILYRGNPIESYRVIRNVITYNIYIYPILLMIEYLLGLGRTTYYTAGFKGLFYATNGISYCLMLGSVMSYVKLLKKISLSNVIPFVLNLAALVILSAKSGFFFVAFTMLIFLMKGKRLRDYWKNILLFIGVSVIVFVTYNVLQDEITAMLARYTDMFFNLIKVEGITVDAIMNFFTSGRWARKEETWMQLNEQKNYLFSLLFGWVKPDNGTFSTVVEMDFHDLFYQYGLIGLLILVSTYIFFYKKKSNDIFSWKYVVWISIVSAALGGHIISGALSGTVFAVNFCFLFIENNYIEQID